MVKSETRFYVICTGSRPYLLPTGYYDPNGKRVENGADAARFRDLEELFKFAREHGIELGLDCYIGFWTGFA